MDVDSEADKRQGIFKAMKTYFGEENVLNICTFKTEGSKSAILTSCRGLGIDIDDAQYMADMIPIERGKQWTLRDCLEGNAKKNREPNKQLINEMSKYPSLMETASMLEGLISGRSIHASGVYVFSNGYLPQNARMRAPNGNYVTAWDMDDSDYAGGLKMDCLTIEALDKIRVAMDFLLESNKIEWQGTLRQTYEKYLHPDALDYETVEMWNLAGEGRITNLFQFDTDVGSQCIKKVKPTNLVEMAAANSLMRLTSNDELQPIDKFIRNKNDITLWYKEMEEWKLNSDEIKTLESHLLNVYGVNDTQEITMELSMDEKISNFTIPEANKLRKAIASISEELISEVKSLFYQGGLENGTRKELLDYVWICQIFPQTGYGFSKNHTFPYSSIALQEMNLYYHYNPIFWNTACLTVNAGAVDGENYTEEESDLIEDDDNDEEVREKVKGKSTDYGKVAKAIGEMTSHGVTVLPPYINRAKFSFTPDEENDAIIFGLKGITEIGDNVANDIVANQPFKSLQDFKEKMVETKKISKGGIINLIKSGAFDEIESKPKQEIMKDYIKEIYEPKNKLTLANINMLQQRNLFPVEDKELALQLRFYNYRKYILSRKFFFKKDDNFKTKSWYKLDEISSQFFIQHFIGVMEENTHFSYINTGEIIICDKEFDKIYNTKITKLNEWLSLESSLKLLNKTLFEEEWEKNCSGTISKWEMDSLCFYHNEHELANVNFEKYGIRSFADEPEQPKKVGEYKYRRTTYNEYETYRVVGTVIDKNKNKNTVTLLTPTGVVLVKFYKGVFNHYNRQISRTIVDSKGKERKQVVENSWFRRGNKICVVGYRQEDMFRPKKYKNSIYSHTVQKINEIKEDGDLIFQSERINIDG